MEVVVSITLAAIAVVGLVIQMSYVVYGFGKLAGALETLKAESKSEIRRNDEITSKIDLAAKELATDQKVLVQRVTKVETICDECQGRGHCDEEKK